ncbi:MAG: hypothetical protein ACLSCV_12155 [Acutalibacteraceae bacterium]
MAQIKLEKAVFEQVKASVKPLPSMLQALMEKIFIHGLLTAAKLQIPQLM